MEDTRRQELANSYLDHLIIAVSAQDVGAPFRTFIDNWYAYEVGANHLTRGGRPVWFNNPCARAQHVALSAMHFHSQKAWDVLEAAQRDPEGYRQFRDRGDRSVRLMVDHAVPLRIIVGKLAALNPLNRQTLQNLLRSFYRLGVIVSDEDTLLREQGLTSSMPSLWDGDVFARYSHVGINPARR